MSRRLAVWSECEKSESRLRLPHLRISPSTTMSATSVNDKGDREEPSSIDSDELLLVQTTVTVRDAVVAEP